LLGDPQAQHLSGATGDMARQPWRVRWSAEQGPSDDDYVQWMSRGVLYNTGAATATPALAPASIDENLESPQE
jgi:hypothetical protein